MFVHSSWCIIFGCLNSKLHLNSIDFILFKNGKTFLLLPPLLSFLFLFRPVFGGPTKALELLRTDACHLAATTQLHRTTF
jgi:hypothetical protein